MHVKLRPFVKEFLKHVTKQYEVVVFSRGSAICSDPVLDLIEQDGHFFSHRLYSEHLFLDNDIHSIKGYDILLDGQRTVNNTVIVDSYVAAYSLIPTCGVPISPYNPDAGPDVELVHLARYLDLLARVPSTARDIITHVSKYCLL